MAELTTQDSTNIQSASVGAELFNDSLNASPLLKTLTKRKVIAGTTFKGIRRTDSIPGGWRTIGTGVALNGSTYVPVSVDLALYSNPIQIDDAFVKSVKGTNAVEDILVEESKSAAEGVLQSADYAAFNTVSNGPASLLAVADRDSTYSNTAEEDSDSAENSIAVFVKEPEVEVLFGGDDVMTMGEWGKQQVTVDGKVFTANTNDITAWIAYAPKSKKSVAVVVNINEDNPFTDATVANVIAENKGMPYTHCFLSRKSLKQLQDSRAELLKGSSAAVQGAMASQSYGIELVVSDSIGNAYAFQDLSEESTD